MTEGSKKVFEYVKNNYGTELTKQQIAEALDVSLSTVTGSVNSLVKKGLCSERIEEVPAVAEGKQPTYLRWLSMTELGVTYDPEEEEARVEREKLEARAAKKAAKAAEKAAKAAQE